MRSASVLIVLIAALALASARDTYGAPAPRPQPRPPVVVRRGGATHHTAAKCSALRVKVQREKREAHHLKKEKAACATAACRGRYTKRIRRAERKARVNKRVLRCERKVLRFRLRLKKCHSGTCRRTYKKAIRKARKEARRVRHRAHRKRLFRFKLRLARCTTRSCKRRLTAEIHGYKVQHHDRVVKRRARRVIRRLTRKLKHCSERQRKRIVRRIRREQGYVAAAKKDLKMRKLQREATRSLRRWKRRAQVRRHAVPRLCVQGRSDGQAGAQGDQEG